MSNRPNVEIKKFFLIPHTRMNICNRILDFKRLIIKIYMQQSKATFFCLIQSWYMVRTLHADFLNLRKISNIKKNIHKPII